MQHFTRKAALTYLQEAQNDAYIDLNRYVCAVNALTGTLLTVQKHDTSVPSVSGLDDDDVGKLWIEHSSDVAEVFHIYGGEDMGYIEVDPFPCLFYDVDNGTYHKIDINLDITSWTP